MSKRVVVFVIMALVLSVAFTDIVSARVVEEHIWLVPAGDIDGKTLGYLKNNLPDCFPMTMNVTVDALKEIPKSAYNSSKKKYNADVILDDISNRTTVDVTNERALVVTDVELYTLDADSVSGISDVKKGISVISLKDGSGNLTLEKTLKLAVRELAHSWGLADCVNPRCIMNPTEHRRDTFCHECRIKLRHRYDKPLIKMPQIL